MQGGLSAGRVQSVAVRLIVEKEREINQFESTSNFKIEALLAATDVNGKTLSFKAEDGKQRTIEDAEKFLEQCKGAIYTRKRYCGKTRKTYAGSAFYHIYIAAGSKPETWLWCK